MEKIHLPGQRRFLYVYVCMALGLSTTALFGIVLSAPALAARFGYLAYFPLAAKPVPTPTFTPTPTPTPTATPTPIPPDVRVDLSCSNVRGGSAQDPSGEYVCFRSYDLRPVTMTDWRVQDEKRHTYVFPAFVLNPGAIVRLHSGPGHNTGMDLYWGTGLIWNNDHDTVYLYDALGNEIAHYRY